MNQAFPELWILRHGETEWNVLGRLQGLFDSPLTECGLAQAVRQREILKAALPEQGVQAFSSPAKRALQTAEIAMDGRNCHIKTDPALQEIAIGGWSGMTVADIKSANPNLEHSDDPHVWKFQAPDGERQEQMQTRLEGFLHRLEGPSVIVTHGVTSRMLRCLVLGLDISNLSQVPGGQGMVHHIQGGQAEVLQ
ncbi:histidine phosphatase family protein [Roseovarius sp. EL26]|uniref:histidine phosphatase family protein n=1 Tax=Roseovarius sp. EL26 TaxID=2126672 RepID=UPI000EA37D98|nr:histidine phosphatase family protein [Roseovarius sp. EL26]